MNTFSFHKMHGLGNDFIIIDNFHQALTFNAQQISALADRYCGIGFDQLLLIGPSKEADLNCQIFNADGSEAEQCGNGMRCIARYVHEENIISKSVLRIATKAGIIPVEIKDYDHIRANMGVPELKQEALSLMLETTSLELMVLSLGNPHAIHRVNNLKESPLAEWAPQIASHAAFPQGINLGFMEVLDRHRIRLRTHERGVGETRACGSNACAAAITGIRKGWLDAPVEVEVAKGQLRVEWAGATEPVFLTGPATRVFSGNIFGK